MAGESVILKQGRVGAELTRIIALNESAKVLFEHFVHRTFSEQMVAQVLMEVYGIDAQTALTDARKWIDQLKEQGVITE